MFEGEPDFYNLFSNPKTRHPMPLPDQVAEEKHDYGKDKGSSKDLTGIILESVEELAVADWTHKEDIQHEMKRRINIHLRAAGYKFGEIEDLTHKLLSLAKEKFPPGRKDKAGR
ncbi:MAG: hypothetical protein HZA14_08565 [Nitrospirae bacterium]|nr:hypothetical protein [Nitrospirota bacterium]